MQLPQPWGGDPPTSSFIAWSSILWLMRCVVRVFLASVAAAHLRETYRCCIFVLSDLMLRKDSETATFCCLFCQRISSFLGLKWIPFPFLFGKNVWSATLQYFPAVQCYCCFQEHILENNKQLIFFPCSPKARLSWRFMEGNSRTSQLFARIPCRLFRRMLLPYSLRVPRVTYAAWVLGKEKNHVAYFPCATFQ